MKFKLAESINENVIFNEKDLEINLETMKFKLNNNKLTEDLESYYTLYIGADKETWIEDIFSSLYAIEDEIKNLLNTKGPKIKDIDSLYIYCGEIKKRETSTIRSTILAECEVDAFVPTVTGSLMALKEFIREEVNKLIDSKEDKSSSVYYSLEIKADSKTYENETSTDYDELENKLILFLNLGLPKIKDINTLDIGFLLHEDKHIVGLVWCDPFNPDDGLISIDERVGGEDLSLVGLVHKKLLELEAKVELSKLSKESSKKLDDKNRYKVSFDFFEDLHLRESKSLSANDVRKIKTEIHYKLGIPTAGMRIWANGKFEFTNISESDARRISQGLKRFGLASNVQQTKGNIDFSHYTPLGQPKNKFNVTGELNLDKFLEENLAKINEASVSEDYVDYNANPQGRNEDDCTIRALSLVYNLSYANVKSDLISLGNKNKSKFNTFSTINDFMEKHRFKKYLNNEDGSINVSTVENFAKKYHHGNYVVRCSDRSKQDMSHSFHLVAVIDGKIYDTWDSADYFVIDAWEVAGNGKRTLSNKGITD